MTVTIVAADRALETLQIHHATCRARRQQLDEIAEELR